MRGFVRDHSSDTGAVPAMKEGLAVRAPQIVIARSRPRGRDIGHIHGLDGIRAFAFFIVLVGHCGYSWVPNGFGVTVFFFLSGYLITTLLRLEWIQTADISVSHFYIRRAFRILPPFYCSLIFAIVMAWAGLTASEVHWKAIAVVQLFLTNYADYLKGAALPAGLTVLWSLAVEEHFYLIFPWVYRNLLRAGVERYRQLIMFGCVCLLALLWRTTLMFALHTGWNRVYTGTDTRIDSILYGSLLAIGLNPVIDNLNALSRRLCTVAALLGAVVLIASIAVREEMFRQTLRYTIQGLALFPIFLFVVRYSDSAVTRFLELKFFTHIGELSYSLYVVHATVLAAVEAWIKPGPFGALILTFTFSYVLAFMIRRFIEVPAYRIRNRILQKAEEQRPVTEVVSSS
jgi:peptidoglycan/LPS O-acetylase OafA/YrhL